MRLLQPCKNVHIARVLPIFHHSILPVQRFSSEESKCYGKRKEKNETKSSEGESTWKFK